MFSGTCHPQFPPVSMSAGRETKADAAGFTAEGEGGRKTSRQHRARRLGL